MARTVVLLHVLPDGSRHFDWLFEQAGSSELEPLDDHRSLITFRLQYRPDAAEVLDAERLEDHRRRYLEYEGPVSGNRGEVRRVLDGTCEVLIDHDETFEVMVNFGLGPDLWIGQPIAGSIWRLVRHGSVGR